MNDTIQTQQQTEIKIDDQIQSEEQNFIQKTWIYEKIINSRLHRKLKINQFKTPTKLYPQFVNTSFICLNQEFKLRNLCIRIRLSPWLERASMIVTLINFFILAMYKPCDGNKCTTSFCLILSYFSHGVYVFFLFEMMIKLVALGLYGKNSYFTDSWNILDFLILFTSTIEYFVSEEAMKLTAIRTIRVLRPLRAINRVPSLRIVVMLLFEILPMLRSIFLLCFIVTFTFGIISVQMWKSVLRNRCFMDSNGTNNSLENFYQPPYKDSFVCTNGNGMLTCNMIPPKNNSTFNEYKICRTSKNNPFKGAISFDNIGYAGVAIFQITSLTNWAPIMYHIQDAHSFWNWIYFVALIVLGSFFLLKLCRVVIVSKFLEIKKRELILRKMYVQNRASYGSSKRSLTSSNWSQNWIDLICSLEKIINNLTEKFKKQRNHLNYFDEEIVELNTVINSSYLRRKTIDNSELTKFLIQKINSDRERRLSLPNTDKNDTPFNTFSNRSILKTSHRLSKKESIPKACVNKWEKFRYKLRCFVQSNIFIRFIFISIIINTFSMGIEYHNQPEMLTLTVESINYFFTIIFFIEMVFKIIADGFFGYLKVLYNVFDCIIVTFSIYELSKTQEAKVASTNGITILRAFRLLRLLKLVRFMPSLRRNLMTLVRAFDNVASFFMLLALFIFIFSILGMNIFGCKFCTRDENNTLKCGRRNFNSFLWSTVTVFQILTQDNWNDVLYQGMSSVSPYASLYFIALISIGNYILFNLLSAILLEALSFKEETSNEDKSKFLMDNILEVGPESDNGESQNFEWDIRRNGCDYLSKNIVRLILVKFHQILDEKLEPFYRRKEFSLFIFSPNNPLRRLCKSLIEISLFKQIIFLFITLNSVTLAMERPSIKDNSTERHVLTISNYIFLVVFGFEMILKIIAHGFFIGKNAYLRNSWNIIDGIFILVSLSEIIATYIPNTNTKVLDLIKILNLFGTLKPLRIISRAASLKNLVQSILMSIMPIFNISLITFVFFIIYAILGLQLFKGKMYYCSGPNIDKQKILTKDDCLRNPQNKWINAEFNFDNFGSALMALFVIACKDGWSQIMYSGIDAVGVDKQPIENYNEWMLLYFISFLILTGFLMSNLFVGVIINCFQKCYVIEQSEPKQSHCNSEEILSAEEYSKLSKVRKVFYDTCKNRYFDFLVALLTCLSIIFMSMEHYRMSHRLEVTLDILNIIFTAIFTIEAFIKCVANGLKRFLRDQWNQLDMVIIILAYIGIYLDNFIGRVIPINPTIIRAFRILRIIRILRLLKVAGGTRALLENVIQAIPQVKNLSILFFLFYFIFATLGVQLFGHIECDELKNKCNGINSHVHFRNFGMSFLTLFRIATGDNWSAVFKDTLTEYNSCDSTLCSSSFAKTLYFVVYILLAQYVLINVVVAVLLKRLDEENRRLLSVLDEMEKKEENVEI